MQENQIQENNFTPVENNPQISTVQPLVVDNKPKTNNFLTVLLSILLFISLVIAVFFAYQTQKLVKELQGIRNEELVKSTLTPIDTADPTTNWKTYINDKYGFSIKYPESWTNDIDQLTVGNGNKEFRLKTDKSEFVTGSIFTGVANKLRNESWAKEIDLKDGNYILFSYNDNLGPGSSGGSIDIEKFYQIISTFKFTNETSSNIPKPISDFFNLINKEFEKNIQIVSENQFYSPSGPIIKQSWKMNILNSGIDGKALTAFLNSQLKINIDESAGIGGGGIDAYENSLIKCFHNFMSQGPDIHNYISCSLK